MSFRSSNGFVVILTLSVGIYICNFAMSEEQTKKKANNPFSNDALSQAAQFRYRDLICVTQKPQPISSAAFYDCAIPPAETLQEALDSVGSQTGVYRKPALEKHSPHRNTDHAGWIDVFVNRQGHSAIQKCDQEYPKGSIILKAKYRKAIGKAPELFTGMVKREKDYNPECGNWEFFTVSGNGKRVTARGKIESCMNCHKEYEQTGFVTRDYPIFPLVEEVRPLDDTFFIFDVDNVFSK